MTRATMHNVRAGESPASIANMHGVSVRDLVRANMHRLWIDESASGFALPLFVGEELFLPQTTTPLERRLARLEGRRPGTLGDAAGDVDEINRVLGNAGLPPNQVQSAVQAYTGLNARAQSSVLSILSGNVTATTIAPLIATGLTIATGGTAAPVVAAIAAALPVLEAIAGIFAPKVENCTWKVGSLCISAKQPYGPVDPQTGKPNPAWTTWDHFAENSDLALLDPLPTTPAQAADHMIDAAFPWYRQTIGCELAELGPSRGIHAKLHPVTPEAEFRRVYYHAWQGNAEYRLNGYAAATDYDLLIATKNAWNQVHAPSSTYTFSATSPPANRSTFCMPHGVTFVGMLLAGDIDNKQEPSVTINTGPVVSTATTTTGGAKGGGGPSAGAAVVTVGIVGATATAFWIALSKSAAAAAARHAVSRTFKRSKR